MTRRSRHLAIALLAVAATVVASSSAATATQSAARAAFPATIQLPDGFQPEGIAIGRGHIAYFGSLADGSIYRVDLRTGNGSIISSGPGTPSVGLKIDNRDHLFVAGGPAGTARVVDVSTGDILASYQLATGASFINDVVLTKDAAYFTDSVNPFLYKLPLAGSGSLPAADEVQAIPFSGDLVFMPGFNVNGIASTPDGKALLVIQSNTGLLFRVNPQTGSTQTVDVGGESLVNGDGLLQAGHLLYVVQNVANTVAVIRLNTRGTSGTVVDRVTDRRFDVPTTVAAFGSRLYLPNARFTTPPTATTPYTANAIRRH